jgi:hypothetical protein
MKRVTIKLVIALAFLSMAEGAMAQTKKTPRTAENAPKVISEAGGPSVPIGGGEMVRAAEIYKTSLKQLLAAREAEAVKASTQLETLKGLYADGLISKRELDDSEHELLGIRQKAEEVRKQLAATDALVVESLAEADSMAEFDAPSRSTSSIKKVAYLRYKGYANWSVSDAGKIEKFFSAKFRRPLPIVALGQSDLHARWGYDHRNAVDVALHPDSTEGKALMNYLSSQGISFLAFRRAVPGAATGPHIHIGPPSKKLTT